MNEDEQSVTALRSFLRWVKISHPHIITEYLNEMN